MLLAGRHQSGAVVAVGAVLLLLGGCFLTTTGLGPNDQNEDDDFRRTDGSASPDDGGSGSDPGQADGGSPSIADDAATGCDVGARECTGGVLRACSSGTWIEEEVCPAGCSALDSLRCAELIPSNTGGLGFTPGERVVVDDEVVFDSTECRSDVIGRATVRSQGEGAPELCIVHVSSLDITRTGVLRLHGTRAVLILADETVDIAGTLDAAASESGETSNPGPGGGRGAAPVLEAEGRSPGHAGDHEGWYADGGGGGGGLCGRGGNGGFADDATGGMGGPARAEEAWVVNLSPLFGGSGGGFGNGSSENFGRGGSGGGALQVSARRAIYVRDSGAIYVTGAGGHGGGDTEGNRGAGGGGGSGGALLLEAATIALEGNAALLASGGGGGGGAHFPSDAGNPGQAGSETRERPSGGSPGGGLGGAGGPAGALAQIHGDDGFGVDDESGNGGGGGGGAGCVLLRGSVTMSDSVVVSPSVAPAYRVIDASYN